MTDTPHVAEAWTVYKLYGETLLCNFRLRSPLPMVDPGTGVYVVQHAAGVDNRKFDAEPVYQSGDPERPDSIRVWRDGDGFMMRFHAGIDILVRAHRIDCYSPNPELSYLLEQHLFGPAMSLWLEARQTLCLHASAVVAGEHAYAFLGHNGAGKTSLATCFLQAGDALLNDGMLPVSSTDAVPMALPGYPQIRLWPDQAGHFLGEYEHLPVTHPGLTKRRVAIDETGLGRFHPNPHIMNAFFVVSRSVARRSIDLERLSPADGIIELVRYSFIPRIAAACGLQPGRLARMATLVDSSPVYRLHFPNGAHWLPKVRAAILKERG